MAVEEGWHRPLTARSPRGAGSGPAARRVSRKLRRGSAAQKLLELIDCGHEESGSISVVMGTLKSIVKTVAETR